MKATGIVRRIDDLGRVVIPKEIRRTMRIREGAPLEIFTNKDGEVIFNGKKISGPIDKATRDYLRTNMQMIFQNAETVNKGTANTAVISDKDSILAVSGEKKRQLADKKISPEIEKMLEERRTYVYKIGDTRIPVSDGAENCHAGIVCPLIVDSDVIGGIIVLIRNDGAAPTETEVRITETAATLFSKQLEN